MCGFNFAIKMADIARRELRKQRILQNSESRLRKLQGIHKEIEDIQTDEAETNSEFSPEKENNEHNNQNQNEADKGDRSHQTQQLPPQSKDSEPHTTDRITDEVTTTPVNEATSYPLSAARVILFITVGVCVRLLLHYNVYSQSIWVIFIITEVFIMAVMKALGVREGASKLSLLTTALSMCGINQDIIKTYTMLIDKLSSLFEDFAIYLFSFIVMHCILINT